MKTFTTITLDKHTAPLMLELVSKAAVAGPQAHLLAKVYAQVERAHAQVMPQAPKVPKANEA